MIEGQKMDNNSNILNERAGKYMPQIGGYKAFIPKPLPPEPPVKMHEKMIYLLSKIKLRNRS